MAWGAHSLKDKTQRDGQTFQRSKDCTSGWQRNVCEGGTRPAGRRRYHGSRRLGLGEFRGINGDIMADFGEFDLPLEGGVAVAQQCGHLHAVHGDVI